MLASALSSVVGAECPVPVLVASLVGLGESEGAWLGNYAKRDRRSCPPREQEGIRAEAAGGDVGLELDDDLRAELEPPVLLVLGVMLDEEPLAVGVEFSVELDDLAAHGQHPGSRVEIPDPQFGQLAPAEPALDGGLHQEPGICVRQRPVDRIELLRSNDGPYRG